MAKIPIILEAGRADGKLIKTNSVYDDNQEKFLSDKIKEIDYNHNNLNNTVNSLTDTVNNNELDIENKLEKEQNRATNVENNLRETINNITEISGSATTANVVTIDTIPNSFSSNVQQALTELFKTYDELNTTIEEEKSAIIGTDRIADRAVTLDKIAYESLDDEPTAGSDNLIKSGGVEKSISNILKIDFNPNAVINSTVGKIIYVSENADWVNAKSECFTGETYRVSGSGGGSFRLWCTTDSRGVVLRNAESNITTSEPINITIQEGEKYIIVNSKANYNKTLFERTSYAKSIEGVFDYYKILSNSVDTESIFCYYGYLNIDGSFANSNSFKLTDFIAVSGNDVLKYKIYSNPSANGGIYCYDKYKRLIDRYHVGEVLDANQMEGEVAVSALPAGTAYIRVFKSVSEYSYLFGIKKDSYLKQNADAIFIPKDKAFPPTFQTLNNNVGINDAIEVMHLMGGGVIKLLYWDSNGVPIQINYDDVSLIGISPEYTKIGTAYNAGSVIVGDGITAHISNIKFNAIYKCKKNSKIIFNNVVIEHLLPSIGTIYYNGEAPSVYYLCSSDSSNKPLFFEEIDITNDAGAVINSALNNYNEVYLALGTYNTTTTIKLNSNNLLSCVDSTNRATINRQQSGNYCIMTNTNAKNTTVQRLNCNSFIRLDMNNSYYGHIVDCVFNSNKVATDVWIAQKGLNVIRLGSEYNGKLTMQGIVELLTYPNRVVYSDNSVKYRIEVYGKCVETNSYSVNINDTMEIEGMTDDAELEFHLNNNQSAISFYDREGEENHSTVKNLKLSMYGTYGKWQYAVLSVNGNWLRFENLEVRNFHECATPRSADDINNAPNTVVDGDRKHGILVSIKQYDNDCHTEFHNVKAFGSPYGFKNCRGFYVAKGSPKFYNCIGTGGGYGRYGYGWVLHHASKPYLYNCIGIGSPYGWGLNNGIQFQMNTEALLFNCIGIGSTNKQRYSNGNKDIVQLNTLSEASHGYCSYMSVHPLLINCIGYAADVDMSYAFYVGYDSRPQIEGGYYGKETRTICNKVTLTLSSTSQVIDVGNNLYAIELKGIGFRDTLANLPTGQKVVIKVDGTIICEAIENVQQQYPPISNPIVPAGSVVTCEVVSINGDAVTDTDLNFDLIVRYMGHNQMTAIYIEDSAYPRVRHASLSGNLLADGLHINCPDTADYLIDGCTIDVPDTNYAVKSSTQKAVKVVNCILTSEQVKNVSFVQTTTLGSNVVI